MEINEKLQQLRKQKGITQEELAERLFVSRTAISKWESGRGLPSIDSLKTISKLFEVTIDELLSGEELLQAAENEKRENDLRQRMVVFGLLDTLGLLFMFIPLYGQAQGTYIATVSLFSFTDADIYMRAAYWVILSVQVLLGIAELVLQNNTSSLWQKNSSRISFAVTILAVLLFMLSRQPWASFFMFWILLMKGYLCLKQR